jgi:uncharacterized protein YeaO (DUF488 family)
MASVNLKRIYEPADEGDGERFLVERLWPRGISKERARLAAWLKDAAPSPELRKWYDHDPAKWDTFRSRYFGELARRPDAVAPLREAARKGPVTLVFASRAVELSCARALKEYLEGEPAR